MSDKKSKTGIDIKIDPRNIMIDPNVVRLATLSAMQYGKSTTMMRFEKPDLGEPMVADIGYGVAKIHPTSGYGNPVLHIMLPADFEEGAYSPPASVAIYSEENIKKLYDFLGKFLVSRALLGENKRKE